MPQPLSSPQPNGFIALASVIVIGAVGVALSFALMSQAITGSEISLSLDQSARAQALADACSEKALDAIRQDENYLGNETVTLGTGTCNIFATVKAGSQYTVTAVGTVKTVIRKDKIVANRLTVPAPVMQLVSWQEVADF